MEELFTIPRLIFLAVNLSHLPSSNLYYGIPSLMYPPYIPNPHSPIHHPHLRRPFQHYLERRPKDLNLQKVHQVPQQIAPSQPFFPL